MATPSSRIDLGALRKELEGFRAKIERWAQGACASSEGVRDTHFKRIRDFQAAIRSLEQQREQLLRQAEEVQQRLECEAAEVGTLQAELGRIRAEQDALPPLVDELKEALEAEAADFQRQAAALSQTEAVRQHKLGALQRAAATYQQRLGLAFERSSEEDEQLRVVFTQIDPREAGRKFSFSVEVQEDGSYTVHGCQPELPLDGLLESLNSKQIEFGGFVKAVRGQFQSAVAAEMECAAGA